MSTIYNYNYTTLYIYFINSHKVFILNRKDYNKQFNLNIRLLA